MKIFLSLLLMLSSYFITVAQEFCGSVPPPGYMENFYTKDKSYLDHASSREATAITYVPIQYHLVGTDAGTGYFSVKDLLVIHCILNERYASANIQFFMYNVPHYINNTRFYTMSDGSVDRDMKSANNIANACNVYIVQNAVSGGTTVCGYATFPGGGMQGIVVAKSCMSTDNTTLTHEMGHFLGLPHTFSGWEGRDMITSAATSRDEMVNGANCASTGDGFCDTPADFINDRWSCPYTGPKQDVNGDFYNTVRPETYYMSYSSDACQSQFSPDQQTEMYQVRTTRRTNYNSVLVPSFVLPAASTLISPASGATNLSPTVTFRWHSVPNATHYHLLVSTVPSFALNNVKDMLVSDTNFTVTSGLNISTTYYWKIKAITLGNTCSDYSPSASFTTSSLTTYPSIIGVSCPGGSNGIANVSVSGGTPPYSYSWSSGEGYNPIETKAAGTYSVTITDFSGRMVIADVVIPQPPVFDIGIFPSGSQLVASAVGGTGPLRYSWSNGIDGQIITAPIGEITVTVTDSYGCSAQKSIYYTSITTFNNDVGSTIKIYPNPISHQNIQLETNTDNYVEGIAKIYGADGRLIYSQIIYLNKGKNITAIATENLGKGIYILKIEGATFTKSLRFVVTD